jgi:hypothetical protein
MRGIGAMDQFWIIVVIIMASGLFAGLGAYLLDPASEGNDHSSKRHAGARSIVLGIIAAACVPLFLSFLQSKILQDILDADIKKPPFLNYLIFTGFCLIAAVYWRKFLDTVSSQVLRELKETKETAKDAKAKADRADEKAGEAAEKAEKAAEVANVARDVIEETAAGPMPRSTLESAHDLPADTVVPQLSRDEIRVLNALATMSFRTTTGVAGDIGLSRQETATLLDALAMKGLAVRTVSPKTGSPRWQITAHGVRAI